MDEHQAMISLRGARKVFPGQVGAAVEELTLEVVRGEVVCLVGPSGCGKTTTLKMINRIVEPTAGEIVVDGRDVRSVPAHELRRGIGYVIQQVGLFGHRTVRDNIATVPRLLGWADDRIDGRVSELIELVGLEPGMGDRYPAELSGGQQQRVGVARALAADPPVLLMDEPFGAVDPIVRSRLQDELSALQAEVGKTIVFVTHDIDEAIKLGDRIAILNTGGVLEQYDSPEDLLREPANDFVTDFLGPERGLKRLSLVPVMDVELVRGPVVAPGASAEEARTVAGREGTRWVGVLDGEILRGWLWVDDLDDGSCVGDQRVSDFRVRIGGGSTLREALDAVVNTRNQVAVIEDGTRYRGMLFVDRISEALLR